jgi:hypothetical protein
MSFTYGTPFVRGRANVTEPVTDRITVPLLDLTGQSRQGEDMQLTVQQALELSTLLTTAIATFCKRADIADALQRRTPLGLDELIKGDDGMTSPYSALDVLFGGNKVDGVRWFVRDEEDSHIWLMVEYVDHRLTCGCPDGEAHAESPDTEPPCPHLRAVVDQRAADQSAKGTPLGVLRPEVFVD